MFSIGLRRPLNHHQPHRLRTTGLEAKGCLTPHEYMSRVLGNEILHASSTTHVFWLWESYSFQFLTLPILKGEILPFPPTGAVNTKMLYAKDPLCPLHPYWPSLVSESFFSHLPTVAAHYCTTELLSVPAKLLCCCYWGILNLYVFTWHVWVTSSHFYFNDVVTIGLNWIIH